MHITRNAKGRLVIEGLEAYEHAERRHCAEHGGCFQVVLVPFGRVGPAVCPWCQSTVREGEAGHALALCPVDCLPSCED
jgi:hypothetical protein